MLVAEDVFEKVRWENCDGEMFGGAAGWDGKGVDAKPLA